ncbi:hypothetical protein Y032_0005g2268 [Ancylostoma ceylanicum]|uniref:Uncharacterized protein n=1 Tax=Ancylostoma ceylanicum TaxID=53326 RepID=A0A016VR46_9BILA|nr:hypothetical protein Y032_0005g2268 [Ancylostoma ceylanicum]
MVIKLRNSASNHRERVTTLPDCDAGALAATTNYKVCSTAREIPTPPARFRCALPVFTENQPTSAFITSST